MITNGQLFWQWRGGNQQSKPGSESTVNFLTEFILKEISVPEDEIEELESNLALKSKLRGFAATLQKKWNESNSNEKFFLQKNLNWLKLEFKFETLFNQPSSSKDDSISRPHRGRPSKTFQDSSKRSQLRKATLRSKSFTTPEMVRSTEVKLYKSGKRAAANILHQLNESPGRGVKMKRKMLFEEKNKIISKTPNEALAFMLSNDLSKQQYINIRKDLRLSNVKNVYPAYEKVREAKVQCYPDNIVATEVSVRVPLQDLLNHTAKRICASSEVSLTPNTERCTMICKWGCDGTNDETLYKQKFHTSEKPKSVTSMLIKMTFARSLFVVSLVPLRLQAQTENDLVLIWDNEKFSSTRFCRPIQFEFTKETPEKTKETFEDISNQISTLQDTVIEGTSISHELIPSMIDGKVTNVLTGTSSSNCTVCGRKPTQLNNLESAKFVCDPDKMQYGLSVLHANIRFFECVIHISFRLELKTWKVNTNHRPDFLKRKGAIQKKFEDDTGLLIDVVLQGKGTTNDGNTARRFFNNVQETARITGFDVDLLQRFSNILTAINSGQPINVENFRGYCFETAKLYLALYDWFYMPPTVHKVLMHGADIIKAMHLPLGRLSEEAAEANNKEIRRMRKDHARKVGRKETNLDVFHMLMASSDPLISIMRKQKVKNTLEFNEDVKFLLNLEGDLDDDESSQEDESDGVEEL